MQKQIYVAALAIWIAACKASPPIKAVSTLEEVMHHMVIPNAQVIWKSVGTIYTVGKVEEIQPRNDEDWLAVEQSATVLTEAGNLLMMEGRAKDTGRWMERARALREAGASLHQAAKARDVAAVFERGGNLFDTCQGCHFEYRYEKDPNIIRSH
ncbi:MAG: hypothetical protein EXQ52_09060 [Bryobacterales bacterium]|nr:hypothetical protein [Bryobacterales bacterium]